MQATTHNLLMSLAIAIAVVPITVSILYHKIPNLVKGKILENFSDLKYLTIREVLEEGFKCYICQSFYVTLILSIIAWQHFGFDLFFGLTAWGGTLLIYYIFFDESENETEN